MIASKLINYSGVSSSFLEGAVTYSNDAKIRRLGVNKSTLENYGAVSSETAEEMVKGITKTSGADIGVSTTGIAGPNGGTGEKPVGLVYLGLFIKGEIIIEKLNLSGNRQKIRGRATKMALDLLRRELLKRGIK
jgi:nicotinamide-nucleotide amidase